MAAKEVSRFDLKDQKENPNGNRGNHGNRSERRNQRLALCFVESDDSKFRFVFSSTVRETKDEKYDSENPHGSPETHDPTAGRAMGTIVATSVSTQIELQAGGNLSPEDALTKVSVPPHPGAANVKTIAEPR